MNAEGAVPRVGAMPVTRAGAVADELRRMIRTGELPGGSRLRQVDIAERFGVSTTPVREAFTALARERVVTQDAHRGVIVFAARRSDVQENYEIRMALEVLAVRLATKLITDTQLDDLESMLEEMERATKSDPALQVTVLNPRFHAKINAAANRPRLAEMIEGLRDAAMSYQSLLVTAPHDDRYPDLAHAEHVEIVASMRARQPGRAASAVRKHIDHNLQQILGVMPPGLSGRAPPATDGPSSTSSQQ